MTSEGKFSTTATLEYLDIGYVMTLYQIWGLFSVKRNNMDFIQSNCKKKFL
jgi:hypothetical protein